jgi:hypothetical protein
MIEYHTVCIRPVMPPKPAPKALAPKLSMAEEAKLVNRRMFHQWGSLRDSGPGISANSERSMEAKARRAVVADKVASLLSDGHGRTLAYLQLACDVSHEHIRTVVREMHQAGRLTRTRGPRRVNLWGLA